MLRSFLGFLLIVNRLCVLDEKSPLYFSFAKILTFDISIPSSCRITLNAIDNREHVFYGHIK